jgi:threonine dehydrogenase-like Zn-dependent dehydrogenase
MKALVLDGHRVALANVAMPKASDECLLRIRVAGICGTDLQMLDGYADFNGILGHEFVGVVEHAPPHDAHWIGTRVVGDINVGCGRCAMCVTGVKEHCPQRTVVGIRDRAGAFAEFITLPASNLHAVPDDVDDRAAVFVEPIAAACRILEQVAIDARWRIAVIGDGRLGLLIAQVVSTVAHDVTIIGRHDEKLALARALAIVALHTNASITDRFDLVVDATGRPDGLARAIEIVRPRGTIVLKSTFHGESSSPLWPVVVQEVTIVGSRCGPFRKAIALLASGVIKTAPLISRVVPLEDYEVAFAAARHELKILFDLSR